MIKKTSAEQNARIILNFRAKTSVSTYFFFALSKKLFM